MHPALEVRATPDMGLGLFAASDVRRGELVTRYHGPVLDSSLEAGDPRHLRHASRTHSLRVSGDAAVPVERRGTRVIDGSGVAAEVRRLFAASELPALPLPPELALRCGSLINSSYEVHPESSNVRVRVPRQSLCAPPALTGEGAGLVGEVDICASRDIPAGTQLMWNYPWK
jgi:hypothetical protein